MRNLLFMVMALLFAGFAHASCTSSANFTTIIGTAGSITDAACDVWAINATGQVTLGGVPDTTTSNVVELAYAQGSIWQENSVGDWYYKAISTAPWTSAGTVSPIPASLTATLSWTAPTAYTNGTAIQAGTVITYSVYQGTSPTTISSSPIETAIPATSVTLTAGFSPGATYCWSVTDVIAGYESAKPTPVCKTMGGLTGQPVTGLSVK